MLAVSMNTKKSSLYVNGSAQHRFSYAKNALRLELLFNCFSFRYVRGVFSARLMYVALSTASGNVAAVVVHIRQAESQRRRKRNKPKLTHFYLRRNSSRVSDPLLDARRAK